MPVAAPSWRPRPRRVPESLLRARLEAQVRALDASTIHPDPLEIVRRHRRPADAEVAGAVAAGLAFGGVGVILASVERALAPLGGRPAEALAGARDSDLLRDCAGFRHRWLGGEDLAAFLVSVRRLRARHGSLEAAFLAGDPGGPDVGDALAAFARALREEDPGFGRRGAPGFFPSPEGGSACKRPLLFLRWMCRDDGIDTGAWKGVDPARLLLPLDTHVARIAGALGLLRRRTVDLAAAREATAALRRLDPADPVRYDFALCRMGILDLCPRLRDPRNCRECGLFDVCGYGRRNAVSDTSLLSRPPCNADRRGKQKGV